MINTSKDSDKALEVLTSLIQRCEKAQLKFNSGTSQHSLLKNRINALYIAKALLADDNINQINDDMLEKALPPIVSIISKCEKAQSKYSVSTAQYKRYINILDAMAISKALINNEIERRNIR